MICDICEREVEAVCLSHIAACWFCVNVLDAMSDLWEVLPEPKATHFGAAVGNLTRTTIERHVP